MRAPLAVPVAIAGGVAAVLSLLTVAGTVAFGARPSATTVHVRYRPGSPASVEPTPTPLGNGRISSQEATVYSSSDVPLHRVLNTVATALPWLLVAAVGLLLLVGAIRAVQSRDLHPFLAWSLLGVGLATALIAVTVPLLEQEATLAAIRGLGLEQMPSRRGARWPTTDTVDDLGYRPQWLAWLLGHVLMIAGAAVAWTGSRTRRPAAGHPDVWAGA